ncbi:hypothetical protein [Neopusillimonas aromaticivorans]|uniref:hypothetical protein n=1 Tax=Neopusillimonas aromaticivorans TaxID=2979868 RepID=UPI0025934EE7|nr:hypothetical protein [Neopusillimonas aromaticivorans]WJJ94928.1 hypothetical protein N7E01_08820 [Neopusillimonas aromaticivorans]
MKKNYSCKALIALGALAVSPLGAAADWFPMDVQQIMPEGTTKVVQYQAVDKAAQPWKICAALPHLKDAFWMATDYGMVEEAKRLGVNLHIMDAGAIPTSIIRSRRLRTAWPGAPRRSSSPPCRATA